VLQRNCAFIKQGGKRCRQAPLQARNLLLAPP
jgi:hypothetical protein